MKALILFSLLLSSPVYALEPIELWQRFIDSRKPEPETVLFNALSCDGFFRGSKAVVTLSPVNGEHRPHVSTVSINNGVAHVPMGWATVGQKYIISSQHAYPHTYPAPNEIQFVYDDVSFIGHLDTCDWGSWE